MKPYKIPSPLPWLIILAVMIIAGTSCGIANKNRSSSYYSSDSTGTSVSRSAQTDQKDSTGKSDFKATQSEAKEVEYADGLEVNFKPGDSTSKTTGPVVITQDTSGTITIDPGGRQIQSIRDTKKRKNTETKQTTQQGSDSSHVIATQQKQQSDSSAGHVNKKAAESSAHTFRIQLPWYGYVIAGISILAVWFFWPYIRKAKSVVNIPYSNPTDKT